MSKQHLERIAALAGTVLFAVLGLFPRLAPFHRVLFSFFFLYLVMLPGWLFSRRFMPWTRGTLLVAASFTCGTALSFVMLLVVALAGGDIRLVGIVTPVLVIALMLARPRGDDAGGPPLEPAVAREGRVAPALLGALVVIIAALILGRGDPLTYTSDSPDHIAYIRAVSVTHHVFPERFYYADGGTLTRDIRKGMIHALWGTINALTGSVDAASVWPIVSIIGSVFLVISIYCAGLLLFGSAAVGLVAAVLTVLLYGGGLSGHQLIYNAGGYSFGKSLYVLAIAFVARYLTSPRPGALAFIALSLFAATGTHIMHLVAALFIVAVFSLSSLLASAGEERRKMLARRIPILFAAAVVPNLPYLILRYVRAYAPNNAIHTQVQGVLFFTKQLYVMNPVVFFQAAGPLGALALFSVFILWKRARLERNLRLLLSGVIAVYLLLFVPLWYPFLQEKMSYLLLRFEFAVPSMIVCAYLLRELWKKLRGTNPELGRFSTIFGIAAVVVLFAVPLARDVSGFAYGPSDRGRLRAESYRNLDDLFAFIDRDCPPGSVIASDPITSYGIPAFTDAYVICPFDQHAIPNDSTAVDRITACRRLFRPDVSMSAIQEILATYGARYLVVDGRIPADVGTMYWKPDRDAALALSTRIQAPGSPFEILYERGGVTLAKLVDRPADAGIDRGTGQAPGAADSLDAAAADRLISSGIPGIRIEKALPERTLTAPGDTVGVDITWVATERCPLSSYVAYLRFETDFPKGVLYRPAWGKPYRKIIEKVKGHRYRFRIDFQPFGGIVPPDTWPLLREMHDRVRVRIPRDVSPGIYTMYLKMADRPQYPNYVLKDILTDNDFWRGAPTATIRVR
jgi:hypothetical protein